MYSDFTRAADAKKSKNISDILWKKHYRHMNTREKKDAFPEKEQVND